MLHRRPMLDDPIVPAELYTAVFIHASLWSMFPIFLPGLSPLPLFVTVGVQLRCIQDTLIRVDYRGRKGGEGVLFAEENPENQQEIIN